MLFRSGVTAPVWANETVAFPGFLQRLTLSDFAGQSVQGPWTLKVVDTSPRNIGQLNGWSLTVSAP